MTNYQWNVFQVGLKCVLEQLSFPLLALFYKVLPSVFSETRVQGTQHLKFSLPCMSRLRKIESAKFLCARQILDIYHTYRKRAYKRDKNTSWALYALDSTWHKSKIFSILTQRKIIKMLYSCIDVIHKECLNVGYLHYNNFFFDVIIVFIVFKNVSHTCSLQIC